MMARTHNSKAWKLIAGTLIFGALMVIGLAAFPQQSADAAPKPKTDVTCKGPYAHLECSGKPSVGDTVEAIEGSGKDRCIYTMTVLATEDVYHLDKTLDYTTVVGEVTSASPIDICMEFGVELYEMKTFFATAKTSKKGGGKKK